MPTSIAELQDQDRRWMDEAKVMAEALFERYSPNAERRQPESMDAVYQAWCHDQRQDLPPLQWFYQGFGYLLGECFRERFDYAWKVVTDVFGTEVSLYMAAPVPDCEDSVLSPLSMVGKRVRVGQPFFADVFYTIVSEQERQGYRPPPNHALQRTEAGDGASSVF